MLLNNRFSSRWLHSFGVATVTFIGWAAWLVTQNSSRFGLLANCTIAGLFIVCNLPVHILASRMIAAERHFWYASVVTILPVCGLVILLVLDPLNLLRPLFGDWAPDPTPASAVATLAADLMVTLGGVCIALVVARYALLMLFLGTYLVDRYVRWTPYANHPL